MRPQMIKLEKLKASDAARILQLPEGDPTLALYEGIECFEEGKLQEALEKFIFAALHYHLQAIPYLQELTNKLEMSAVIHKNGLQLANGEIGWIRPELTIAFFILQAKKGLN